MTKKKCIILMACVLCIVAIVCTIVIVTSGDSNDSGDNGEGSVHKHTYGDWIYDDANHWKECTGCNEKKDISSHIIDGHECTVCEYSFTAGLVIEQIDGKQECAVTGLTIDGQTDIVIPSTYNGFAVTTIANRAFLYCTDITTVEIPPSVKTIEDGAFIQCSGLKSIEIPDSVISIGRSLFKDCSGLESVKIPSKMTSIPPYLFNNCSALKNIEIPSSVTRISNSAFVDCKSLESITIPDNVEIIDESAFYGCSGLKSIIIPEKVKSIGYRAFAFCYNIEKIEVSAENEEYYSSGNCVIEKLSKTLIFGCRTSLIPNDVTKIYSSAFYGCKELTSIEIPASVETIEESTFWSCYSLSSIIIPKGVSAINSSAFTNCTILSKVFYKGTKQEWNALDNKSTQLQKATCYYYSEQMPNFEGNYWHYVNGVATEW